MPRDPVKIKDRSTETGVPNEVLKASKERTLKALAHYFELESRRTSERHTDQEVELVRKALEVVGSARLAQWMQTPIPALKGQTPYSQMQFEEGRKEVEKVLVRIDHGVY